MKKIEQFTNQYSVTKTLKFRLNPIGKTEENLRIKRVLEEDEERATKFKQAKKLMDSYHKFFIGRVLREVKLDSLGEYVVLFNKTNKSDTEKKQMLDMEKKFRNQIANAFHSDEDYMKIKGEDMIDDIMPNFLESQEEKDIIASFKGFLTAFSGYMENRENMYSSEAKATSIANRCIHDNLPRFISNYNCFKKIKEALNEEVLDKISDELQLTPYRVSDCFTIDFFNLVLDDQGILVYNTFIGGYTKEDGTKIKGVNEYINLYNQSLGRNEKSKRLPMLKTLYRQILADKEHISFVIDSYEKDEEVLKDLRNLIKADNQILRAIDELRTLVGEICEYDTEGIFIKNGQDVNNISKSMTGDWSCIRKSWNAEYDESNPRKKSQDIEKYEETRKNAYKKIESFSLNELSRLASKSDDKNYNVSIAVQNIYNVIFQEFCQAKENLVNILNDYPVDKKLAGDVEMVGKIKDFLDAIKGIEYFTKSLVGTNKETNRDEFFYGKLYLILDKLYLIDKIYDKVRNYMTKKSYSHDKYKLYFKNVQCAEGWDINKEKDYRSALFVKEDQYYLAIIDKNAENAMVLQDDSKVVEPSTKNAYKKMILKQIPNAQKYVSIKQIRPQNPPAEIIRILERKADKKTLTKIEQETFIEYVINDFLVNYPKIQKKDGTSYFDFHFKKPSEYEKLDDFMKDIDDQAYSISYEYISAEYIDKLVEEGRIYLFQIYNKDFSKNSHGTDNLHTMYFKQLFLGDIDKKNIVKLNGGAELFFRKASIKKEDRIIHLANQPIKNKNVNNPKMESVFEYDLIKDKRFTVDQYEIHVPITLNPAACDNHIINNQVRIALRKDENPYVIGIDRGERNLLYICVIDGKGNIVEQRSLNQINDIYNGVEKKTDYHELLDRKAKEREKARQDWKTIENIKEIKNGYMSQIVHVLSELMIKYDAVVALEDLNFGFKNSRVKVEKQVYQKFEKAMIDKMNYLVNKKLPVGQLGSITNGYQLANNIKKYNKKETQNGFIFYIPAWLTSKIDPSTGFVDMLKPKYENLNQVKDFIMKFDAILFNGTEFEFDTDYEKFDRTDADYRKKWKICSYGERIRTFRNPKKNNEFVQETVVLNDAIKDLLDKYHIEWSSGKDMRAEICNITETEFYRKFIELIRLILQMRNSISGTDIDYLISPVKGSDGVFYDSRHCSEKLPKDADANGAYNIARKVLWAIDQFKLSDECNLGKTKIAISKKEWLQFAQTRNNSEDNDV